MDTSDSTSIPDGFKCCSKCHEIKPATFEFFYWRKDLHKFRNECCQCCNERVHSYRESNVEKIRESQHRWYESNADRVRSLRRLYYKANIEKVRERVSRWRNANSDRVRESMRRYYRLNADKLRTASRFYRTNNPDKMRESYQRWYKSNSEKTRSNSRRRRALKRSLPATFTEQDWLRACEYFNGCCAYCGRTPSLFDNYIVLHQEHHIPLSKGGGYTSNNILPACQSCNFSKHDKDPEQWIKERFGKTKAKKIEQCIKDYFINILKEQPNGNQD